MRLAILFVALVFSTTHSYAQYSSRSYSDSGGSFWGRKHFISLVLDRWSYEEPTVAIEDAGLLYGLNYTYRDLFLQNRLYFEFSGEYLRGETTYEGRTIGTPSAPSVPITAKQKNVIYKGEVWFGTQIPISPDGLGMVPKVGFMYRKLIDADDELAGDYRREQEYFVIPIGLDFFVPVNFNKLVFSIFTTINFKGKNKTFWTDVGGLTDHDYAQDDGSGSSLEVTYLFLPYSITAFYRSWDVEDSDSKYNTFPFGSNSPGYYYEPENKTQSYGVRVGFTF